MEFLEFLALILFTLLFPAPLASAFSRALPRVPPYWSYIRSRPVLDMGVHEIEQGGGSSSAKFVEKGEKSTPPGLYSKMRDTLHAEYGKQTAAKYNY